MERVSSSSGPLLRFSPTSLADKSSAGTEPGAHAFKYGSVSGPLTAASGYTREHPGRRSTGANLTHSRGERVAFEDAGQLLEIDGQRPQHRRRAAAQQRINLIGQLIIPSPASLAQRSHELTSQLGGSVHTLHERSDQTVAGLSWSASSQTPTPPSSCMTAAPSPRYTAARRAQRCSSESISLYLVSRRPPQPVAHPAGPGPPGLASASFMPASTQARRRCPPATAALPRCSALQGPATRIHVGEGAAFRGARGRSSAVRSLR